MRLYTSNFKKSFYSIIFLTMAVFFLMCGAIEFYIQANTTKTKFNSSVSASKAEHLNLADPAHKENIIFIGSSRTLFFVNSDYFVKAGMKAYNFGVNAHTLSSYPSMIDAALTHHPKYIVLNMDVQELYMPLRDSSDIHYADIKAYINTNQSPTFINNAISYYIGSFNLIRNDWALIYEFFMEQSASLTRKLKQPVVFREELGLCNPFSIMPFHSEVAVLCSNGDGILLGGDAILPVTAAQSLTSLDPKTIRFIKYLISKIEAQGIVPIIVFPPSSSVYSFNLQAIQNELQVPIFDFTNLTIPRSDWVDAGHFNGNARNLYSKQLFDRFMHYIETQK